MAKRPVYVPEYESDLFVRTEFVEFTWHAGMAPSQRQKSIDELHLEAIRLGICNRPLEVSSKSREELGVKLSAFNLGAETQNQKKRFTVETAFQSSKVFKNGGPYTELLYGTSIAAKKDPRLKESGNLIEFRFFGEVWELNPKTAFYDWLYLQALRKNLWAMNTLCEFDAFTDIEFNPQKSINCQAYSVALFKSLSRRNLLDAALESKQSFLEITGGFVSNSSENSYIQPNLFSY